MSKTKAVKKPVKKPTSVTVTIDAPRPRKKNLSRTAFKKGGPNPHAFVAGNGSPNPGGKPRLADHRLSRSLLVDLSSQAPDTVCDAMSLPRHSSWSQAVARKLIYLAVRGDLAAINEIRTCTEGSHISADFNFPDSSLPVPLIELVFVPGIEGRPDPEYLAAHPEFTMEPKALPSSTE